MAMFCVCLFPDNAESATRPNVSRGAPVAAARKSITQQPKVVEPEPVAEKAVEVEPEIIENKSTMFEESISESSKSISNNSNNNELAEQIRKQRAAIEARENADAFNTQQKQAMSGGTNACDSGLRKCMQSVCGSDFSKCALDGDTILGDKFNKCRKDLNCSAEEFKLFTTEIKADRDLNIKLSSYTAVVDCGNNYNKCIANECGATYTKCLNKTSADAAIKKCANIAQNCKEQDSGLSARFSTVIGKLRENAESEIKTDEERMYKLRDLMRTQCETLGAAFDERSFDCVYTVNFFAGENQTTPIASRKVYAGNTFVCMQEWFGVNATTYKENAYRETRAQTAASSAMLGSGIGTAVGLATSGAMTRAIDTQKAKKGLDQAKALAEDGGETFGTDNTNDRDTVRGVVDNTLNPEANKPQKEVKGPIWVEESEEGEDVPLPLPKTQTTYKEEEDGTLHAKTTFDTKKVDANSVKIKLK